MPDNQSNAIDALLPTIRAALMRAYDHGAADAVQKLVAQIAPPKHDARKRGRQLNGVTQFSKIVNAVNNGVSTAQEIADAIGAPRHRVAVDLAFLARNNRVVRVGVGRYAPAVQS